MPRKDKKLRLVFSSNNLMEAEETRCFLEGSGITALVLDNHLASMNPAYGAMMDGVKVVVPEDQFEAAQNALRASGRADKLPATGKSFHPYADMMEDLSVENKRWILFAAFATIAVLTIAIWIVTYDRG